MEKYIPFKVYTYWNEDEKPEVRRFGVDKNFVASYNFLTARILDMFPALIDKTYTVSWTDEDGDDIVLSSDHEIMTALTAMRDLELVKLHIHCKDRVNKENNDCDIVITAVADNSAGNSSTPHSGVICDGCDSAVVGFRYKCTTCDDYDLCSKCEGAGLHPEHCMVRVPMPNMPRTVIRTAIKRSRHFLKTVASAIEEEHCKKQRCEKGSERKRRGDYGHGRHGHGRHGHGHGHGDDEHHQQRPRTSWIETFATYMNEFANLAGDVNIDIEKKPQEQQKENNAQTSNEKNAQPAKEASHTNATAEELKLDEKILQQILNVICTSEPGSSNSSNAQKEPQTSSASNDVEIGQGDHKTAETNNESVKSEVSATSSTNTNETNNESTSEEKGDKSDDWTVINNDKDIMDTYVSSGASSQPPIGCNLSEEFQECVKISNGQQGLYPPLNVATAEPNGPVGNQQAATQAHGSAFKPETPSASTPKNAKQAETKPKPRQRHPIPQIDKAIKQMMAMGFTNEDGWLTHLIENKNGNIAAVLDLLTPVNPSNK